MKNNVILFLLVGTLAMFAADLLDDKMPVRYSQIFADKKITLTESLSWAEKLTLPNKKGFVSFE